MCSKVLPGEHWSSSFQGYWKVGGGDFQVIETVLLRRPVGPKLSSAFHFGPQGDQLCTTRVLLHNRDPKVPCLHRPRTDRLSTNTSHGNRVNAPFLVK